MPTRSYDKSHYSVPTSAPKVRLLFVTVARTSNASVAQFERSSATAARVSHGEKRAYRDKIHRSAPRGSCPRSPAGGRLLGERRS
jgi:hypothetical protein